ncbi:MAG: hypothetical protein PHR96_01990 [Clostridia bacterium]|nr:hypothetical protein [Clostridia bacterium]
MSVRLSRPARLTPLACPLDLLKMPVRLSRLARLILDLPARHYSIARSPLFYCPLATSSTPPTACFV